MATLHVIGHSLVSALELLLGVLDYIHRSLAWSKRI